MATSQQKLHNINYTALKGLRNLELDFEPHPVTGIFGINGSGKSTIIHSLLCLFKPADEDVGRRNFKFSQYFIPTTHTRWTGSSFKISHSYRQDQTVFDAIERTYRKAGRWNPRYENRPARNVYFVGINTCVPAIENERTESLISLTTTNLVDAGSILIKNRAEYVLNRQYQEYNQHDYAAKNKKYLGVSYNGVQYSSLAMGAGEQRIFKILEVVYKAPRYSLIIIDEIDLTLHTDALNRLLGVICERAAGKNLQVIFTSHREELTKRTDINIRHIHQTATQTMCFKESNPDCIARLTGIQNRVLEVFVEDDLAEVIALKVIEELNIKRHCSVKRFGAIDNSFVLAAGIFLKGEDLTNISIITDGDRYTTQQDRDIQMQKFLSGNEPNAVTRRQTALSCIRQYILPANTSPESFIRDSIRALNDNSEVVNAAHQVNAVLDKHDFVNKMLNILGYQEKILGLWQVVNKLTETPQWNGYTSELRNWLIGRVQALNLN